MRGEAGNSQQTVFFARAFIQVIAYIDIIANGLKVVNTLYLFGENHIVQVDKKVMDKVKRITLDKIKKAIA